MWRAGVIVINGEGFPYRITRASVNEGYIAEVFCPDASRWMLIRLKGKSSFLDREAAHRALKKAISDASMRTNRPRLLGFPSSKVMVSRP